MFNLIIRCFAGLVMVSILAENASALVTQTPVTPAVKEKGSKISVTAEKGKENKGTSLIINQ